MRKKLLVKIGGRAAEDDPVIRALFRDIALVRQDADVVLLHGGGVAVSRLQQRVGILPRIENGVRITSAEEMELVDMALAGAVGCRMSRIAAAEGVPALSLSGCDGGMIVGESVAERTGRVLRCDPLLLVTALNSGYLPIVNSVSADDNGEGLNINADEAALALAGTLGCFRLLFLSDIEGVLDDRGETIPRINREKAEELIKRGVIRGGMIPKVRSGLDGVGGGVGGVVIGRYAESGDLERLLDGQIGTTVQLV